MHALGEGKGNPLQCSCLENPRDGGAWWAAVYGVAQSRTRLKRLSSRGAVWSRCLERGQRVLVLASQEERQWSASSKWAFFTSTAWFNGTLKPGDWLFNCLMDSCIHILKKFILGTFTNLSEEALQLNKIAWVLSCLSGNLSREKEMATHSSILAWKIPWTEDPGRLQSMGCKELDTTEWLHFTFVQGTFIDLCK